MATPSLTGWTWLRMPYARMKNGLVVCPAAGERYSPGADTSNLLTALIRVRDETDALSFVKQWGLLGFAGAPPSTSSLSRGFESVLGLTWILRGEAPLDVSADVLGAEVAAWYERPSLRKEPVEMILSFAEDIRAVSEVVRILDYFGDDRYAATYEAEQWVSGLPDEYRMALAEAGQQFHGTVSKFGSTVACDSEYLLKTVIKTARMQFSDRSQRGIWVRLDRATGRVGLEFDGLFRFIEYILLSDNAPAPTRCEDPQCGQLFFPIRSSRRYCPPPPGMERSLCEQRHGKEKRRAKARASNSTGSAPVSYTHLTLPTN